MATQLNIKDDRNISGMTELAPSSKPTLSLLVIAFCALLWNSVFITQYKYQWYINDRESAIILLGFFIAGNAALLIAFCYFLVFYYIGQPRLKISNRCPRLGEKVALAWELPDYRSINRLAITLEGFESMENLYEEKFPKNVIASIKLADTADKRDIKSGTAEFKIPGNSMHSFTAGRFQIIWQLKLYAEKEWKDRRLEYIIEVQPHEV
ncbi:MAG: hypothetical protein WCV67_00395 [Victivallaceae bacterium]|jgi:hypothetical protein